MKTDGISGDSKENLKVNEPLIKKRRKTMKLHSITEDKVEELTNHLMKGEQDFCTCEHCKIDVIVLSLNRIQTKYVISDKRELFGRASLMTSQYDTDLVNEVTKSINVVRGCSSKS